LKKQEKKKNTMAVLVVFIALVLVCGSGGVLGDLTSTKLADIAKFQTFTPDDTKPTGPTLQQTPANPEFLQIDTEAAIYKISGTVNVNSIDAVPKAPDLVALQTQEAISTAKKLQHRLKAQYHLVANSTTYQHVAAIAYPLTAVGCLRSTEIGAKCFCSAWRVGQGTNIIMTAGHCVFNRATKIFQPFAKVTFLPAYDISLNPSPAAVGVVKYYIDNQFYSSPGDWRYDWAIVVLASDIPIGTTGSFGITVPTLPMDIVTDGYPSNHDGELWKDSCNMKETDPLIGGMALCSAYPGQSGSVIYKDVNAVAIMDWSPDTEAEGWRFINYVVGWVSEAIRTKGVIAGATPAKT